MKFPKDIVLSGGGANGMYMLKAIKLIENRIGGSLCSKLKLNSVSGSSIGSFIGLGIILDYTADEYVENAIPKEDNYMCLFDELRVSEFVQSYGFTRNDALTSCVDDIVSYKLPEYKDKSISFSELYTLTKIQFNVCVTNVNTAECEVWNHLSQPNMPISFALRVSGCVPILFSPIYYKGVYYIDGGISNTFPTNCVTESDTMLGFQIVNQKENESIGGLFHYVSRIMTSMFHISNISSHPQNVIFFHNERKIWDFHFGYSDLCTMYNTCSVDIDSIQFFKVKEKSQEDEKI